MGFLTSLFGGEVNMAVTVLLALGIVLVLIVLGVWALKLVFNATGNVGRGRNRRLAIVDSMPVDTRRQLVLVRRDDVDHLLLIGGAHDLVVETGITPPAEPPAAKRPRSRIVPLPVSSRRKSAPTRPSAEEPEVAPTAGPAVSGAEPPAPEPEAAPERTRPVRRMSLRHTGLLRPSAKVEPELDAQSSTPQSVIEQAASADSDNNAAASAGSDTAGAAADEVNGNDSGDARNKTGKKSEDKTETAG